MKNKSNDNTNLYILLGILLIAVIVGTILGKSYYDKTRENFATVKKLIYLYMPNCNFCKDFDKIWDTIVKEVNDNKLTYDFTTAKYDMTTDPIGIQLATDNNIKYAPSILFVTTRAVEYNETERTKDKILQWAKTQNSQITNVLNRT